jgi:hypothetical protein
VDFYAPVCLDAALSGFQDRSLVNFFFIKHGDSDSLSVYRLFPSLVVLDSFRSLLESVPSPQSRLVIMFCSPLLRFRICSSIHDSCPLCKKAWLWDSFFILQ